MYLKLKEGTKIQVGLKSVFEIVLDRGLREIRVFPRGGTTPYHVSWHYGKNDALKHLAEIESAIRRGDKIFEV